MAINSSVCVSILNQ